MPHRDSRADSRTGIKKNVHRRNFIRGAGAAAVVGLSGCNSDGGGEDGGSTETATRTGTAGDELADKLVVLSYGGSLGEAHKQNYLDRFQEEFGVQVEKGEFGSDWDLIAKQKAGGGRVDVIMPSARTYPNAIEDELILPLRTDNVPRMLEKVNDPWRPDGKWGEWNVGDDREWWGAPWEYGASNICYNTEAWPSEVDEPTSGETSWNDLFVKPLKDELGVPIWENYPIQMAVSSLGYSPEEWYNNYDQVMEETWDRLNEWNNHVLEWYDSASQMRQILANERALGGMYWHGRVANMQKEDYPIETVVAKEGGYLFLDTMAVAAGTERRYTAEKLINYYYREENRKGFSEMIPYAPTYDLSDEYMTDALRNNPDIEHRDNHNWYDPTFVSEHKQDWAEKLQSLVRS
jgi:spermidine/putrescine-binding protein